MMIIILLKTFLGTFYQIWLRSRKKRKIKLNWRNLKTLTRYSSPKSRNLLNFLWIDKNSIKSIKAQAWNREFSSFRHFKMSYFYQKSKISCLMRYLKRMFLFQTPFLLSMVSQEDWELTKIPANTRYWSDLKDRVPFSTIWGKKFWKKWVSSKKEMI